jgi:hypothetical protein
VTAYRSIAQGIAGEALRHKLVGNRKGVSGVVDDCAEPGQAQGNGGSRMKREDGEQ